jgi:proliferating cell nuclear antigen
MAMEARFAHDAAPFKRLIDAIKEVVTEVLFDCTKDGICMQAMDNSHISLVSFKLDARSAFSHYTCPNGATMGINIIALQKVLKLCNNDDILTLQKNEDEDKLTLLFEDIQGSKISHFNISLMEIEQEQLGIPDVEYKTYFTIASQELLKICKDFKDLSDTIKIASGKFGIKFSFENDTSTGEVTLQPSAAMNDDSTPSLVINIKEPTSAMFSSKYLMFFTRGSSLSNTAEVCLSDDMPLVIKYIFREGTLEYFMAPKMEEE